ncbi:helix-turn-helix domain-containing protein [Chromobacterium amazonense]|uniref:helix-turn-helix domain-containing protein n=1 Tax=Chromobacterium amazonense TaxID=1382803 RepID=UPI0011B23FE7
MTTQTDEILLLDEAAKFMRIGERTLRSWVADKRIKAARSSGRGGKLLFLRSDCIAAIRNLQDDTAVDASDGHQQKDTTRWQSSSEGTPGTVISLRRTASALEQALAQRTKNKPRNCTTR